VSNRRLLVTLGFPPAIGGMQRYLYARCLAHADRMVVLAPQVPGWAEFDRAQPFPVHRWPDFLGTVPGIKRACQLGFSLLEGLRLLRHYTVEMIECGQALPFGLLGLVCKRLYGLPYLVWAYGDDILKAKRHPIVLAFLHLVLREARGVATISQYTRGELMPLGVPPQRILVLAPDVDTARFHPGVDPSPVLARHGLAGRKVILTVARLMAARKGVENVLAALPMVLQEVPEVAYLIVGEGPARGTLEALVQQQGLVNAVVFTGAVSDADLPAYYNACQVFVMPSCPLPRRGEVEGFGIVYLEAGACGKPVVAGRGGGVGEAVQDGVTGLLVDPQDVPQIAGAMVRLLQDPALAAELGRNGLVRAQTRTPWGLLNSL